MRFNRSKLPIFFLIFLGTLAWSLTMVKSGLVYPYGMGFWGPNGHDGVWHIALINSFVRGSLEMPVYAGEALKNYHIGFDLLLAAIVKLTGVSANLLYFQVIPPVLAVLIGFLTYKFVLTWSGSRFKAFWAMFFVYFGGNFGWIITLVRGEGLAGESMFWSQQAISTLINPSFALSLVILLLGLIFLKRYSHSLLTQEFILTTLFLGILIEIKVYAGVLVLGGLLVCGTFELIKNKTWHILKVYLSTFVVSIFLFYLLNNSSSNSLLVFSPFWFLESMMVLSDRVGWNKFYMAMTTYRMGHVFIKGIIAYSVAFAIFLVGNLGTRILGGIVIGNWLKDIKKLDYLKIFILTVIILGIIIPMLFLQKGTPWNTIQFFYYSLFFVGILTGLGLADLIEKRNKIVRNLIVGIVLILTIPSTLGSLRNYLPFKSQAIIPNEEISALTFLSKEPDGVVLGYPFDRFKAKEAEKNPPRPLYLYESTAYISAYANKAVYLEDEVNLDITDYDWESRRQEVENFLNTLDQKKARNFLRENNISYIYWVKPQRTKLGETELGIEKLYENSEVQIFRVF